VNATTRDGHSNRQDVEQASQIALVRNLYGLLTHAIDYGTLEEYGDLLAEDVVWELPEQPETGLPAQVRRGRDDALRGAAERREAGIQGPGTATWHVVTNIGVTPGVGEANAMAYWHFYRGVDSTPELKLTGVYRDRFVRAQGGWVLAHRRISSG